MAKKKIVLGVCGGHKFVGPNAYRWVEVNMRRVCRKLDVTMLVQGGADGPDLYSHAVGVMLQIPTIITLPALWNTTKPRLAAGPIRNRRILKEFKPDVLLVFPGGPGTADMSKICAKAGVRIIKAKDPDVLAERARAREKERRANAKKVRR